ncbi:MAG: AAA family ATPase [Rhizobacter sp.]|nr:AAA family ATPase [Chlorobiales bacterium]
MHTDTKAEIRKPQPVAPFNYLSEDGSNLVNVLFKYLNDREFRDTLEKVLRFAIPDFEELYVDSPAGNFVNLTWKEKYLKRELYASDLSDGTLRLLCLCAILLPNKKVTPPKLICIDEPELGLHPRLLKLLAELIQSKSEESQIIITTHSPEFLSFFKLEEIVAVRREAGKTHFERPASKERLKTMLENYETSIGELWLQGELGDTSLKLPQ